MSRRNGNGKRGQSREAMLRVKALAPRAPNLRHGGFLRLPQEAIDRAVGELVAVAPHLAQPRYRHSLSLLARVMARIQVMDDLYSSHPKAWLIRAKASGKLEVSAGEKLYVNLVETARRLLADLGLTPQSARALGLPVESPDEKDVVSEARELAAAQEREFAAYRKRVKDGGGDGEGQAEDESEDRAD